MRRYGRRGPVVAVARVAAWASLAALILAPAAFLVGRADLETVKWVMLAATGVWFVAASLYMWKEE